MRRLIILMFVLLMAVATVAFTWTGRSPNDVLSPQRAEILMRNVAHQVLLAVGDSTTRVLPVDQPRENVFFLQFERPFSFYPDSLIRIVDRSLAQADAVNYRVSVFDCQSKRLVYGFEIAQQGDIVPCEGRFQPEGCYSLQVEFLPGDTMQARSYGWVIGLLAATFLGFIGSRLIASKKVAEVPTTKPKDYRLIGKYHFYPERRLLKIGEEEAELSFKECQLLHLLADNMNVLVGRDQLMKIWEDEGVFVGRSLDVFISRLRKRLQQDQAVRIVNAHGKGYKLEVTELVA